MCFCIDYRELIKVTIHNKYMLLRINNLFDQLQGAQYFSKIELRYGCHQLHCNVPKTAHRTRYGHYEFLVIPFEYHQLQCLCYHSREQHEKRLRIFLEALRTKKLYAKFSCCLFSDTKSLPKVSKLIRRKLKLSLNGYNLRTYLKFVVFLIWPVIIVVSLKASLKYLYLTAPILVFSTCTDAFHVYSDASKKVLGCVLMKNRKVISYASRQLKPYEVNYPTHDLKLAAVIFASRSGVIICMVTPVRLSSTTGRRWFELLKDYDVQIQDRPGKVNVVANALNRKAVEQVFSLIVPKELASEIKCFRLEIYPSLQMGLLASLTVEPTLISRIKEAQQDDCELWANFQQAQETPNSEFRIDDVHVLWFRDRLCVPNNSDLKDLILTKAHNSMFSVHRAPQKCITHFWWIGMKRDIADFVSHCLTCQQVKIENQRPGGLLQSLNIPMWKWEHITMDFIVGLPRTTLKHDAIWVVVDRLTKSTHFLPVRQSWSIDKLIEVFQREIVRLHGTPISVTFDRDPRFTSRFWEGLHKSWDTRLNFSTAFHPQTDGQSEHTIKTLEDMLRACALE
ncbi:LOW QUALITY PROTEIN: hypothetical protein OSB04_028358 [Centaurea solstitialis]|uniref:Integrase catalytic domain-containing protein n=1 Tax=Centaurea solstitialis TaxID=347529 RepID=A0AA38VXM2_9ASTR|nr:LOW QUALITY PROTEIN: hypothetical protein OSB04_028358 [Centaurea solstitialis]